MISKFWNVKLAPARPSSAPSLHEEEAMYTPASLREVQRRMVDMAHRIWTVLSAFDKSGEECISDMLRFVVSYGSYLDAVRGAERFIFHVEALLAALDDIHRLYVSHNAVRAFSYARESRLLCRKTVDLFTSLSNAQKDTSHQDMTQELLALITGIAHLLKTLICIALLGALKLQWKYPEPDSVSRFLYSLQRMCGFQTLIAPAGVPNRALHTVMNNEEIEKAMEKFCNRMKDLLRDRGGELDELERSVN
jgi:hypothetical protein